MYLRSCKHAWQKLSCHGWKSVAFPKYGIGNATMFECCCPTQNIPKLTVFSAGHTVRHHATSADNPTHILADDIKPKYDAIVIGAGHNGLVAASYLQKAGHNVCVLEKRHIIGGAAVTEEIVPGFKFSRASYVLSLLRPQVYNDLKLKEHGLKVYLRDPNAFTPLKESYWKDGGARSLTLGSDKQLNQQQIAQFSAKDAQKYTEYEAWLDRLVVAIDPLLDSAPVSASAWFGGSFQQMRQNWKALQSISSTVRTLGKDVGSFYELLTAPAAKVLDRWFESEPLKATLATDSVIGAMISPLSPGSGYVLLHHVMGELEGVKGAWGYVEGGMGNVSNAIARCAQTHGADIFVNKAVSTITTSSQGDATGVVLEDGTEIQSKMVLSCATPRITFLNLVPKGILPDDFVKDVSLIDYESPVTKINVAVNRLPNFVASPNKSEGVPMPHHQATIHLNCEHSDLIFEGYKDAQQGRYSRKPVIEMTIPSSLDPTVAPPGCHVVQLFTQYTPYTLAGGKQWDQQTKDEYTDLVFDDIEQYAPGFKASVVGRDILTPPDLERIMGLTGGNIFHGSMSLDQLYFTRPVASQCGYRSPVPGLYLCGSGAHPGGGVMGAPGRLAALAALQDF